jgi:hypothetical protein
MSDKGKVEGKKGFEYYFGHAMTLGVAVNVFRSAGECAEKGDNLRKQITDMNSKISDIQDKYATILGDITKVDQNILTEIQKNYDTITELKKTIKVAADDFNDSFKLVQLGGVIIITIVFFLLLLKYYGLLGYLNPFAPLMMVFSSKEAKK